MSRTTPLRANVEQFAERAANKADQALDHAHDQIDALSDSVHSAPASLSRAAAQVEEFGRRGLDRVRQTSSQIREQALRASDATTGYIRDEPVKSVLIAAATGAVVATLMTWLSRSRSSRL